MGDPERWLLTISEDQHLVEILHAALGRRITWSVAGAEVATRRTSEERVVLDGGSRGALSVRLPRLMGPARRVTWYSPGSELGALAAAHAGIGGVDLDPEPGSKAAAREAWIREHPRQYAARRAGAAAAGALAAVLGVWLLSTDPHPVAGLAPAPPVAAPRLARRPVAGHRHPLAGLAVALTARVAPRAHGQAQVRLAGAARRRAGACRGPPPPTAGRTRVVSLGRAVACRKRRPTARKVPPYPSRSPASGRGDTGFWQAATTGDLENASHRRMTWTSRSN